MRLALIETGLPVIEKEKLIARVKGAAQSGGMYVGGDTVGVKEALASLARKMVAGVQYGITVTWLFAGIPVSFVISTVRLATAFAVIVKMRPSLGLIVLARPMRA